MSFSNDEQKKLNVVVTGYSARKFAEVCKNCETQTGKVTREVADLSYFFIEEGFNIRQTYKEEQIEGFAYSYENGIYVPPLDVEVVEIDGVLYLKVVDGHTRYMGAKRAEKRSGNKIILAYNIFKGNDGDKVFHMFTSSQGVNLNQLDRAFGYQRLKGMGYSNHEIAQRLRVSDANISNGLLLITADKAVQNLVQDGKISASRVVKLIRDEGLQKACAMAQVEAGTIVVTNEQDEINANEIGVNGDFSDKEGQELTPEEIKAAKEVEKANKAAARAARASTRKRKPAATLVENMSTVINLIGEQIAPQMTGENVDEDIDSFKFDLPREQALKLMTILSELDEITAHNSRIDQVVADAMQQKNKDEEPCAANEDNVNVSQQEAIA
ncbi:ParB/RepB/Spo0J family partition protein [Photobacterium aquae]|uniref:ParB/RepB/Spo0J family partition protein n=1 Tax=Photobacterium aquae TaxID=1195763 RepID=UPI00069EAFF8|nr:hypothetical protein [Photobacterium aquae]